MPKNPRIQGYVFVLRDFVGDHEVLYLYGLPFTAMHLAAEWGKAHLDLYEKEWDIQPLLGIIPMTQHLPDEHKATLESFENLSKQDQVMVRKYYPDLVPRKKGS